MKDQWSRQIEAERRLARSESELRRLASQLSGIRQSVRTQAQNPSKPVQGGSGGGGIGAVHRFPTEYEMWVEWDVTPSLKTGASSNPTADLTSLAEAVSFLETGITMNLANEDSGNRINAFLYDSYSSRAALYMQLKSQDTTSIGGRSEFWSSDFRLALYDDGEFMADPQNPTYSTEIFQASIPPITSGTQTIKLGVAWPRRNGIGSWIGSVSLWAYRNTASEDEFITGPTYGESGFWSFAMTTNSTTYHNAGSGTIFLRWGTGA